MTNSVQQWASKLYKLQTISLNHSQSSLKTIFSEIKRHSFTIDCSIPAYRLKQRFLLSAATHWRRHSSVPLSSAPLVQRPNSETVPRLAPDDTTQQTLLSLSTVDGDAATPCRTPLIQHDPKLWKLVVKSSYDDHTYAATCYRRLPKRPVPKTQPPVTFTARHSTSGVEDSTHWHV